MSNQFKSCIEACYACAAACKNCSATCLDSKDVQHLVPCIKITSDCATICTMTAKMLAANTPYYRELTELCAKICRDCAKVCEKHSHEEQCRECAKVCQRCAESCEAYSEELIF
jgi:hypothetical protein